MLAFGILGYLMYMVGYIVYMVGYNTSCWLVISHTWLDREAPCGLVTDLGRFRIRSRNQRTNLNPNPDLIPDSESCVVESDLESESCRFESESDSDS